MYGTGQSVKPQWWCSVPDRLLQHRCADEFRSGLRPYLRSTVAVTPGSASRVAAQRPNSRTAPTRSTSSRRRESSWCGPNRTENRTEERRAVHLRSAPNPFRAALSEKTANHMGDCTEALMALVANECSRRILARTP